MPHTIEVIAGDGTREVVEVGLVGPQGPSVAAGVPTTDPATIGTNQMAVWVSGAVRRLAWRDASGTLYGVELTAYPGF